MSKFFCDTNSELDFNIFKSLNIELIKMPYTIDGEEFYYDLGEKTDLKEFFDKMRKGASVKTQALNEIDYLEYFEPILKSGEDIIYVSFSHKMSATFESFNKAVRELKERYPERKISIVDSKRISVGAGSIVYESAKLFNGGATDDEVIKFVEGIRERTKVYFTVETLEYLKKGGRLSKTKYIFGTLFNVKPIISIDSEGKLANTETVKGRKSALKRLVTLLEKDKIDTNYPLYLLDADCQDDIDLVKEMILEKYPSLNIINQKVGPVIGCHCGPDTIGMVFTAEKS